MQFDVSAAVRPRRVEVALGGCTYTIAARPAADWILALCERGWLAIVPGWLTDAGDALDDALDAGQLTAQDFTQAAKAALEASAGCRWWTAVKLVGAARTDAAVLGELAAYDLDRIALGAYVQAVYRLYTRHATKTQVARVDSELARPPDNVPVAERYDEEAAADAFEALARTRGAR